MVAKLPAGQSHISKKQIPDPNQYLALKEFQNHFTKMMAQQRVLFRQQKEQEYFDLINETPILLLISSAEPKLQELVLALRAIEANAIERGKAMNLVESKNGVEFKITEYYKNSLSLNKKIQLKKLLLHYASFEYAYEITSLLLQFRNIAVSQETIDHLSKELTSREGRENLIQIGIQLGINLACFIPIGRLVGLTAQVLFKTGCLTVAGLPTNVYFFISSLRQYNHTFVQFLSTTDGKNSWASMQSLKEDEKAVLLSVWLFFRSEQTSLILNHSNKHLKRQCQTSKQ